MFPETKTDPYPIEPELRLLALSEAIRSSNSLASPEDVIQRAEKYLEFLKNKTPQKEIIVAVIDDFTSLTIYGKSEKKFSAKQNKGHREEVAAFLDAVKKGNPSPVSFEEIYQSTLATFKVLESASMKGKEVSMRD